VACYVRRSKRGILGSAYFRDELRECERFSLEYPPPLGVTEPFYECRLARGPATGDSVWRQRTDFALQWLNSHPFKGNNGSCWGNHLDLPKGLPTIVLESVMRSWTGTNASNRLGASWRVHTELELPKLRGSIRPNANWVAETLAAASTSTNGFRGGATKAHLWR